MSDIRLFKYSANDIQIEYQIIPQKESDLRNFIQSNLDSIDSQMAAVQQKLDFYNNQIDRLTNHADALDYTVAVASGILCGLMDSYFVGEFSLTNANSWGTDKVNRFVEFVAKAQSGKTRDLYGSVSYLEKRWGIASDNLAGSFGGATRHHLFDLTHHPTPVGLACSILTQFTGNSYGCNADGKFQVVPVKNTDLIGKDFHTKISLGVVNWFFHLVSDVAGSSSSVRMNSLGTGLPGPIVSLLFELSKLPFFSKKNGENNEFSRWVAKLWNGTLKDSNGTRIPVRFDLRTEVGVLHELEKQSFPVILNECIVRSFYFIRRFHSALCTNVVRNFEDFVNLDWKNILPFKCRTIARMLTISTGTFVAVDFANACIKGAMKSGGNVTTFLEQFVMNINFVGIGRFAVAVVSDIKMGIERNKYRNQRINSMNQMLHLSNAKIFYKQAEVWIEVQNLVKLLEDCEKNLLDTMNYYEESTKVMSEDFKCIEKNISNLRNTNPAFIKKMQNLLK